MKIKVTVELEEGVKATRTVGFTAESLLCVVNVRNTQNLEQQNLEQMLISDTEQAAASAMHRIYAHFKEHGLLLQRNKHGMRETLAVKDVDEAAAWLEEGE